MAASGRLAVRHDSAIVRLSETTAQKRCAGWHLMFNDILRPGEFVGIKQAVEYIGVQERALRRWYKDDPRLGRRCLAGGKIELSLPALLMYRTGQVQALDLYSAGERDHDLVRPFIESVMAEVTKA